MRTLIAVGLLSFSLVCLGESNPPTSTKPSASEQKNTGATKQPESAKKQGTEEAPLFVKVLPPHNHAEEADEARKEREQKSATDKNIERYTLWLAILTGVLGAIGFCQLIVFGLQATRLRETVEMVEKTERPFIVEAFTHEGILPNNLANKLWPDMAVVYSPYVSFGLVNCGRSPAIMFEQYVDLLTIDKLPEKPPYENVSRFGDAILPSGDKQGPTTIFLDANSNARHFSSEEWQSMRNGEKFFLLFGYIKYKSIFGKAHETRWGYRFHIKNNRTYFAEVGGENYNKRT